MHNRVKNIRANINVTEELYHVSGKYNISDTGSKFKRIPDINNPDKMSKEKMLRAEDVAPDSPFHLGPDFYKDLDKAEKDGIIRSVPTIRRMHNNLQDEDLLEYNAEFRKD